MDQALADLRDASAFVARLLVAVEAYASAEAETAAALDDVAECRAAATHVAARDQTPGDALYAEAQRLSKAHGHAMSACSRVRGLVGGGELRVQLFSLSCRRARLLLSALRPSSSNCFTTRTSTRPNAASSFSMPLVGTTLVPAFFHCWLTVRSACRSR